MKKIYLTLIAALLLSLVLKAQAPAYAWAKSGSGTNDDGAYSVATDASGNVYIAGAFSSSTITFDTFTLTNNGSYDMFLVKYDAGGNVLWAKSAGGANSDVINGIAVDDSGNVIVTGSSQSIFFYIGSSFLANNANQWIFVIKYDANGNVIWSMSTQGDLYDAGTSVSTDAQRNIYVTGFFSSNTITFDSVTLYSYGGYNTFIVKFSPGGNVLWGTVIGHGNGDEFGQNVIIDASGDILCSGWFTSAKLIISNDTLINGGGYDMFLVKYDPYGNFLWAKSAGSAGFDVETSIATDTSDNVIMTGYYQSQSITFGTHILNNVSTDSSNIFVVKYDPSGNVLWAKSFGNGNASDEAFYLATDASGNTFVTGMFRSAFIAFDSDTMINAYPGYDDVFVIKLDANGNVKWVTSAGGDSYDDGLSIAVDALGNVYVAGQFQSSTITFDSYTLTNANPGPADPFVAKIAIVNAGIKTFSENNINVNIFPNPFSTSATLSIDGSETYKYNTIKIYNLLGQEVRSMFIGNQNEITINRDNLAAGMYFYKLITNKNETLATGKMIIE